MSNKIIEGSKQWGKVVPDEHAIKCIHLQTEGAYKILKFTYVASVRNELGAGFEKIDAVGFIPAEVDGILIARSDDFPIPEIHLRKDGKISFGGIVHEKAEIYFAGYNEPKFSKVFHYSARSIERQKSDEDAPEWLKNFAQERRANVAYFEF